MRLDKDLEKMLWNNDLFWKLKFRVEYKGYVYPKYLDSFDYYNYYFKENRIPKKGWRELTFDLFKEIKSNRFNWEDLSINQLKYEIRAYWFEKGNELILKEVLRWNPERYQHALYLAKKYFEKNTELNTELLTYILTSLWMNDDGSTGINIFHELIKYKNKIYDKGKVFLTFLKKKNWILRRGEDKFKENFIKFIDKLSKNEEFKNLFYDEKFLLKAIEVNGVMFKYLVFNIDKRYTKNVDVILKALKTNSEVFKFIDLVLQDDKDFVYRALKINFNAFVYISEDFKDDKIFFFDLMKHFKDTLYSISTLFGYAGKEVQDDENIILYSFFETISSISFGNASKRIRNNVKIFKKVIEHDKDNIDELYYAGEKVKNNPDFMKWVINIDKKAIEYAGGKLLDNLVFMKWVINIDIESIKYATPRVKYEIFKEHVKVEDMLNSSQFINVIENLIKKF